MSCFSTGVVIEQQWSAAADAALGSGVRKASATRSLDMQSGRDGGSADLAKDVALRLVAGPLSRAPVVKSDEAVVDALGTLLACMQSCCFSQGGPSCNFSSCTLEQTSSRCCQASDMS